MLVALAMIAAGAAVLAFSGDKLVDFASGLAEKLRLSPAVIGLTVVPAGTSAPELFVSVMATFEGAPAIALGNVVGSNIANVGLILAGAALLTTIPFARKILQFEYPSLVLASWITVLLCRDGWIDRLEAAFFFLSMIAFTAYAVWVARREATSRDARQLAELVPHDAERLRTRPAAALIGGLVASLAGLVIGARVLVSRAVDLARAWGMTERAIGLTLVSVGTSLPELVASAAAALKRQHEMAVNNVVGSNIFNLLLILGVAGLARPIPVDPALVRVDLWVMMAFALLLFPLVAWDRALTRRDGALLLGSYVLDVAWLVGS